MISLGQEHWFFSHGVLGNRRIYHDSAVNFLNLFKTRRVWNDAVKAAIDKAIIARPALSESARFLVLGWCFTQAVKPLLVELAAERAVDADVTVGFHDDLHLIAEVNPDVVILQLSHRVLLTPIFDRFHALDAAGR